MIQCSFSLWVFVGTLLISVWGAVVNTLRMGLLLSLQCDPSPWINPFHTHSSYWTVVKLYLYWVSVVHSKRHTMNLALWTLQRWFSSLFWIQNISPWQIPRREIMLSLPLSGAFLYLRWSFPHALGLHSSLDLRSVPKSSAVKSSVQVLLAGCPAQNESQKSQQP